MKTELVNNLPNESTIEIFKNFISDIKEYQENFSIITDVIVTYLVVFHFYYFLKF